MVEELLRDKRTDRADIGQTALIVSALAGHESVIGTLLNNNADVKIKDNKGNTALIIAAMSAAKAMNINPIIICSLGASQWGANRPDFHFLNMLDCLSSAGVFNFRLAAVSLGGEKDEVSF